jgi:hypothetical protein
MKALNNKFALAARVLIKAGVLPSDKSRKAKLRALVEVQGKILCALSAERSKNLVELYKLEGELEQ